MESILLPGVLQHIYINTSEVLFHAYIVIIKSPAGLPLCPRLRRRVGRGEATRQGVAVISERLSALSSLPLPLPHQPPSPLSLFVFHVPVNTLAH